MMTRALNAGVAVLAIAGVVLAPSDAPAAGRGSQEVVYKGRIVDESGKPVSGVFPLTFKLYKGVKARKPLWSESLWVAVDGGTYTVTLGSKKRLPARKDLSKLVLGVEIRGVGEVVREPFLAADRSASAGPRFHTTRHGTGSVKYADTAGYAVEAEHAKNADRLQDLTVEDITRKVIEEGGGAGGKVKIGRARRYGARVGGPGGTAEYNEVCPRGYVMTGIRGAAGLYVDSIQIVCSPIE